MLLPKIGRFDRTMGVLRTLRIHLSWPKRRHVESNLCHHLRKLRNPRKQMDFRRTVQQRLSSVRVTTAMEWPVVRDKLQLCKVVYVQVDTRIEQYYFDGETGGVPGL